MQRVKRKPSLPGDWMGERVWYLLRCEVTFNCEHDHQTVSTLSPLVVKSLRACKVMRAGFPLRHNKDHYRSRNLHVAANGWDKNRPLFNVSLAPCALPALWRPSKTRSIFSPSLSWWISYFHPDFLLNHFSTHQSASSFPLLKILLQVSRHLPLLFQFLRLFIPLISEFIYWTG